MIGWRFEFGTLSDLSATIFSVFLLLLVLLIDTAVGPRPAQREARAIERAPMDAAAMTDLLYQRRLEAVGTRIDVLPGRITVVTPSGTLTLAPQALDGPLRAGWMPDPVSLYVFANESYAPVIAVLRARGRAWRELSVPAALRQTSPGGEGGWTADFSALLARPLPKEAFVRELATLLGGGAKQSDMNTSGDSGDRGSRYAEGYNGGVGYIIALSTNIPLDAILSILSGVSGIGIMMLVERRSRARAS
ncbi:hypothetical protein ACUSIJ_08375 [Pseudochelatococcus sp. B33]